MKILKSNKVSDIKKAFHSYFPHLIIEFYGHAHEVGEGSENADQLHENTPLVKINPNIKSGEIIVNDELTVKDLETAFENDFGLHVQVFRRSGGLWLQTSSTDHWTLKKQNEKGGRSEIFANK